MNSGMIDTSLDAYAASQPHLGPLQEKVYAAILASGKEGMTDQEIQEKLVLPLQTQIPRRYELHQQGLIERNGKKRITQHNRQAHVWVASHGREG